MRIIKKLLIIGMLTGASICMYGCGDEDDSKPQAPTKYIREADDAVDQYNENIDTLNQTGNSAEEVQE